MTNQNWGLRPILFHAGNFPVESYPVFVFLAIATGLLTYALQLRKDNIRHSNALYIALFAIFGGTIGAKLPIIMLNWNRLISDPDSVTILLSGRTIIGGLIGGAAGTFFAKKAFGIKERLGNQIAIPVAVAMAVGRLGCLFRGCCYGKPTFLPWGVDFGDHIARHPTQAYEMLFDISLAFFLSWRRTKDIQPGELFKLFLNCYLSFRFFLEFIRMEKIIFLGFTDFQVLCVISLLYINRHIAVKIFNKEAARKT